MHELPLTKSILETALRAAQGHEAKRIKSIRLLLSDRSSISLESLDSHFEMLSKGTIAEGARLDIVIKAAVAKCVSCGLEWQLGRGDFICPNCGKIAPNPAFFEDEVRVDSVEIE